MASLDIIYPIDTSFEQGKIQKSLDRLLELKVPNINVLLIYRNSDDVNKLKISSNQNVKYINKNFSNYFQAFNKGIQSATSEFIAFIVPGDYVESSYREVNRMIGEVDMETVYYSNLKNGVSLYMAKSDLFDKPGTYDIETTLPKGLDNIFNKVYRRSIIVNNNITFMSDVAQANLMFNLTFLCHAGNYKVISNNAITHNIPNLIKLTDEEKVEQSNKIFKSISFLLNISKGELKNYLKKKKDSLKEFIFYKNIDFVFPYVTSDDLTWQEAYKAALIKNGADENSWQAGIERFRDSGTFKYFFRALDKFCPWIHQVHMIVMSKSQVPEWLNTDYVHIITHDQFMPKEMLPTFNSSTIEMFLHNLPDVANTFIYANDDMIFTRPIEPTFFFDGGKPIYQVILRNYQKNAPGDRMRCNDYNLYFNTDQTKRVVTTQHGPIPFKKSWLAECYNRFEKEMLDSCTPFRTETDLNQYLYALYQMMEKEIVNTKREYRVYNVNSYYMPQILAEDFSKVDEVCINDSNSSTPEQWAQVIAKFEEILPDKCKYEL